MSTISSFILPQINQAGVVELGKEKSRFLKRNKKIVRVRAGV